MTRAVHALHMIATPAKASEKSLPKTFAGMLRATLAADKPTMPSATLYEHGNPAWMSSAVPGRIEKAAAADQPAKRKSVTRARANSIKLAPPLQHRERGLERTSPSHLEGGPKLRARQLLEPKSMAAFEYGTLVHAWLEQISWLDEPLPDDAAFAQTAAALAAKLGHLTGDLDRPLAEFRRQLAAPAVTAALSRAYYDDPSLLGLQNKQAALWKPGKIVLEVQRERPFAVRLDDQLVTGSIDRLVVIQSGGKPVAADVIDFKTDDIAPDDSAALAKKIAFYQPQINAYRLAVAQMLRLPPERVAGRLIFMKPGRVEAVGSG
jgi:ATP-dependent exoDNAse (exonuclease V) beta subunit